MPLGLDEYARGAQSPSPDDLEGFEVSDGDEDWQEPGIEVLGDLPIVQTLQGMPGTAGLHPFPQRSGCPPEVVYPYPERYPNIEVSQKGAHFFSQWGGLTGIVPQVATPASWKSDRLIRSPKVPGGGSTLWMIDVWAYEVLRLAVPPEALTPLDDNTIMRTGGAAPVIDAGNACSRLKVRIMWWASSGGTTRVLDIAQGIRCAVEASLLTIEVLYPNPGTVQVKQQEIGDIPRPPRLAADGGTVLDTIVGCSIVPTTSTPGQQLGTNTMIVEVPAGQADVPIFIPPGTRSLTAYQGLTGAIMTPTWRFGRDPAVPMADIGAIDLGTQRRAVGLPRPGSAGMVLTGAADGQAARTLTLIFELEI